MHAGSRPTVPSRATYRLWFGLAAIMGPVTLAYLMWARGRGVVGWTELRAMEGRSLVFCVISLALGIVFRIRWLRKRRALRAYELMLSSIARASGS